MQQTITMTTDTTAVHGGTYLTDSARPLTPQAHETDDRSEAAYKAAVVIDARGHLELAWWTNGDSSYVAEDGSDGIPVEVLQQWAAEIHKMAADLDDSAALHELADYVSAVASVLIEEEDEIEDVEDD